MIDDADIIKLDSPQLSAAERLYVPQIVEGMKTTLRHFRKTLTKGPMTVQYPEQQRPLRVETYRGVHRLNRDEQGRVACVACFMCETACPVHCIHIEAAESPWPDREKYPAKFDIDELRCIYCGMCEEACPVDAIELTPVFDLVGERPEDIPPLVHDLLTQISLQTGRRIVGVEPDALEAMSSYPWPGNVRELENTLERAVILAPGDRITLDLLPFTMDDAAPPSSAESEDLSIKRRTRSLEERLIRLALEETGGNRTRASEILEISPRALQYKLKEYGIVPLNSRKS